MYRRDYTLLKKILENKYDYDYKFIIIGKGPPCKELLELCKLYPNLLDTVAKNYAKGFDSFSLFEIGDIFECQHCNNPLNLPANKFSARIGPCDFLA